MSRVRVLFAAGVVVAGGLLVSVAHSQQPGGGVTIRGKAIIPAPEPIAETKVLMEGMAQPNMRGLSKTLREKPKDAEAWTFARGQSLLIAEMGNLLLMRPPKTNDRETWLGHAGDLRDAADKLARATTAKDYAKSRAALATLANICNRCHQSFQVPGRIDPFADQ
jgi:cytochrome c556